MGLWARSFDVAMRPLELAAFRDYRRWLVPRAHGSLLEVGSGTGANIPFLPCEGIRELTLSDVTIHTDRLRERLSGSCFEEAELVEGSAEELPFGSERFDSALATLVFCSVPDQLKGLKEVRRVLRPGGSFLFLEHVLPPANHLSVPMKAVNPVWRHVAGGCNLTRNTEKTIKEAGFTIESLRRDRLGVLIAGVARAR